MTVKIDLAVIAAAAVVVAATDNEDCLCAEA